MKKQSSREINRIPLFDREGKKLKELELDKDVFSGKFNEVLLYQALVMYRANQRRGTASTKTRGDVRGGGKKPWRQKGTGRARVASIRNPIWRGGGIAFGPHPRDFRYNLPKKMKKKALISSLNAKLKSGEILAVEDISLDEPKTRKFSELLKKLKITEKKALFLVEKIHRNLALASRNIRSVTVKKMNEATALDVLSNEHVVLAKDVAESLQKGVKE